MKIKNCFDPLAPKEQDDDHNDVDDNDGSGDVVPTMTAAAAKLSSWMSAPASTNSSYPFHTPLKYWDIYDDDFSGTVQGNKWQ